MLAVPSISHVLTDAVLAELPEWTALPLVASLAGVPLACTEDMGSHHLIVQDGHSREKRTRVSLNVLADPAPDYHPHEPATDTRETGKG